MEQSKARARCIPAAARQPAASFGDRNRHGATHPEQSLIHCYSMEVVGVRGPPLILFYRGRGAAPDLKCRVFSFDAGPKELLCSCFAVVLGQVATEVCWQYVSIDLLVEGLQLLAVHKHLAQEEPSAGMGDSAHNKEMALELI